MSRIFTTYIESVENLIYKLECFAITFCRWVEMDQKLANPRSSATGIFDHLWLKLQYVHDLFLYLYAKGMK